MYSVHVDREIQRLIVALSDALCEYERATSIESVLIIRQQGGFVYRAQSGKPGIPEDVSDTVLVSLLEPQ